MRAFSIFQPSEDDMLDFVNNFLCVNIDYKRFSFSDRKEFTRVLDEYFPNFWIVDGDNSNSIWYHQAKVTRIRSNLGYRWMYDIVVEGIGPVNLLMFEIYDRDIGGACGRVDFYGAYFHFQSSIQLRILELYNYLEIEYQKCSSMVRCTRMDVALDFSVSFPQNAQDFIIPAKSSARGVRSYHSGGLLNSISYLSRKNSGYGVRMYNKILDIEQKGKQAWYSDALPENMTRIEFEFYPPYSNINTSDSMISYCCDKIFGYPLRPLGLVYRPDMGFKIENAYEYFVRYAKSKGVSINYLINEVMNYHLTVSHNSIV